MFLSTYNQLMIFDFIVFPLAAFMFFHGESQKCMNKTYNHNQ